MSFEQLPPLPDDIKDSIRSQCVAHFVSLGDSPGFDKPQWREGVTAIDDWICANMASVDAALPDFLRDALTMQQKAYMFFAVIQAKLGDF